MLTKKDLYPEDKSVFSGLRKLESVVSGIAPKSANPVSV